MAFLKRHWNFITGKDNARDAKVNDMINKDSSLIEVAAVVSDALTKANVLATLSGGAAVSIYTDNAYQSKDLDFVTAVLLENLKPVMESLGFQHSGTPRLSQFDHPDIEWYIESPPAPLAFGHLQVDHKDCKIIEFDIGKLRIITPTHSVMDRLAAAIHWNDQQSRIQAILVAANNAVDSDAINKWFSEEGESAAEYARFRRFVSRAMK